MRFIWFRLYGLDPESGTENHSLYLEWNYHSLIIEPNSRLFKLDEILESKILLITRKWHEKETLSSSHLKTPSHQPLDWSPKDRDGPGRSVKWEKDKYCNTQTGPRQEYSCINKSILFIDTKSNIRRVRSSFKLLLVKLSTTRPRQQLGSASFDKDNHSSVFGEQPWRV
jgi:hypothetical protein